MTDQERLEIEEMIEDFDHQKELIKRLLIRVINLETEVNELKKENDDMSRALIFNGLGQYA